MLHSRLLSLSISCSRLFSAHVRLSAHGARYFSILNSNHGEIKSNKAPNISSPGQIGNQIQDRSIRKGSVSGVFAKPKFKMPRSVYVKNRIFVGNLSPETTSEKLLEHFSKFGDVFECKIERNEDNSSKGFGHVIYKSRESAKLALDGQPHVIDGAEVLLGKDLKLSVTFLPENISKEALENFFAQFGEVQQCIIKRSKSGSPYGRVTLSSPEEISKALADRPHRINEQLVLTERLGDLTFKIYVGGLPKSATDDSLYETFSRFGKIVHWKVVRDPKSNESLDYGFVNFESEEQAQNALSGGPHILDGTELTVKERKGRDEIRENEQSTGE